MNALTLVAVTATKRCFVHVEPVEVYRVMCVWLYFVLKSMVPLLSAWVLSCLLARSLLCSDMAIGRTSVLDNSKKYQSCLCNYCC